MLTKSNDNVSKIKNLPYSQFFDFLPLSYGCPKFLPFISNVKKMVTVRTKEQSSDLFRKSFDLTFLEKKSGKVKVMTVTYFIFRRKSAENGQSQLDFGQNLLDFL